MVYLNTRIILFIVFFDIFVFILYLSMAPTLTNAFTNTRDYNWTPGASNYTTAINSTDFGVNDIQDNESFSLWAFIKFLFSGGMSITGSSIPLWISIPLTTMFLMMNIILVASIISWVRELIGFT
jgi:hypothetical protein